MTDKTGILLLSHGSRLDDGEEVIKAYKEMYAEEFPDMPVEIRFYGNQKTWNSGNNQKIDRRE